MADINKQIELMMQDMDNEKSCLYGNVFLPSGMTKEKFIETLKEGIIKANEPSFYGGYDKIYAGYTFVNGRQVYFKFSAPKAEMTAAAGSGAPFLEMYMGGTYLIELGHEILLKYVMPYYYKEFGGYSNAFADLPQVKNWVNFYVSED